MKLLVDMNLSPRWAMLLADAGIEAVHWSSIGLQDAPDAVILDYAIANNYVVLTNDLDFSAILAATNIKKPSVVQLRSTDLSPDQIGKQVLAALQQMSAEIDAGALVTIDSIRTRIRVLPFHSTR
jgi:predicted nuclease of predicted toxin-antitoxin system